MMIFSSHLLSGSGFGSNYLLCVRVRLYCIRLHFVQLVMVHDLFLVNIKSVTFLLFLWHFISFKNSMNFYFFEIQSNVEWNGSGLYSIWLKFMLRFYPILENCWMNSLHRWLTESFTVGWFSLGDHPRNYFISLAMNKVIDRIFNIKSFDSRIKNRKNRKNSS